MPHTPPHEERFRMHRHLAKTCATGIDAAMRVLIAPDKFKGSMPASEIAKTLAESLRDLFPQIEVDACPIADGGEGTVEALIMAQQGEIVSCPTLDAQQRPREASYGMLPDTEAVMEMSAASGLALVSDLPLCAETASTYGTGLMMLDAWQRGAQQILIGIGGSATNDGGSGMARALGYRFLDVHGHELHELPQQLDRLHHIEPPTRLFQSIRVACDVTNPLLGPLGCTRVYGPQKGITDFAWHEQRLSRLAEIVQRDLGADAASLPGSGAAGGLGFGLRAFTAASLISGFDLIAEAVGLRERVQAADLIITGEGRMDAQTLHGKGPHGVALLARSLGKPIIAYAGGIESHESLAEHFDGLFQIKPPPMPVAEAMQKGRELLREAVKASHSQLRTLLSR
jgi:glycerate 2-kinase